MEALTGDLKVAGFSLRKIQYNPFESGPIIQASPSTILQRELWKLVKKHEESTLCFNETVCVEFLGEIKFHLLSEAFQYVLNHHDSLRMVFSTNGEMISITEKLNLDIATHDFSAFSDAEEKLVAFCQCEVLLPFNLESGPCVRGHFIKLKNERSVFVISAHGIVCDQPSLKIILKDLSTCYCMLEQELEPKLPASTCFLKFAISENIDSEHIHDKEFWQKELKSFRSKALPADYERQLSRSFKSKRIDFIVPETTVKAIKNVSLLEKCSFYNTLITAFSILISKLTQSDEIVIGVTALKNDFAEDERLVGRRNNILPLKFQLALTENFTMLLKEVRSKVAETSIHKSYHWRSLVAEPFNVVFNFEQQLLEDDFLFGKTLASYKNIPREFEQNEIYINAVLKGEELILECQYNSELFELSTITNWLQAYAELLSSLTEFRTETLERIALADLIVPQVKESLELPSSLEINAISKKDRVILKHPPKNLDYSKIFKSMLVLSNHESNAPLCLFHGTNGDIHHYFPVADEIKTSRPVFAFQSLGKDGVTDPLSTIEEMANAYIRELKVLRPKGPYILAGHSIGGILAFEVASQLSQLGDRVEKLIFFDAFGPSLKMSNFQLSKNENWYKKFCADLKLIRNKVALKTEVGLYRLLRMQLPLKLYLKIIRYENYSAVKKYDAKYFVGDTHLITPRANDELESDPAMGWKGFIKGKIKVYRLKKNDAEFFESKLFIETLTKILADE